MWDLVLLVFGILALLKFQGWHSYFGGVDAIQFSADPKLVCVVHGLMYLKGRLSRDRLQELLVTKFIVHKRFTQRAVRSSFKWPYWEDDPQFSITNHIFDKQLDTTKQNEHEALEEFLSSCLSRSLHPNRPLWEMHLIEDYNAEGSVIVYRFHHCVADGIAMLRIILAAAVSITDRNQDREVVAASTNDKQPEGASASSSSTEMPEMPSVARWLRTPLQLDRIKRLGKRAGGSVNDVLIAAVSGALRTYLKNNGTENPIDVQTCVWVSLRPLDLDDPSPIDFGNSIAAVYVRLPLSIEDPVARIKNVNKQINELKNSPEPIVSNFLMRIFGWLPPIIGVPAWYSAAFKVTTSMSNVPGPQFPCCYGGVPISSLLFFVPPQRSLGHFITMMSYNGTVGFGLASDARLIPEPRQVCDLFEVELQRTEEAAAKL